MFYPGQFVLCIRDDWEPRFNETNPTRGSVYTVRDVYQDEDMTGIRLYEIRNPERMWRDMYGETSFNATGFRPLSDSSLTVFHEIARHPRRKIKEDA